MFSKILTIGLNYLTTTFQSRFALVMGVAMPLVFTFVLGQVMTDNSNRAAPTSYPLAVVREAGQITLAKNLPSDLLLNHLAQDATVAMEEMDEPTALAALEENTVLAVLVIPADFDQAVLAGTPVQLSLKVSPRNIPNAQILERAVALAATRLDGSLRAARVAEKVAEEIQLFEAARDTSPAAYFEEALLNADARWTAGPRAVVSAEAVTHREDKTKAIPDGFGQSAPGMMVMYAMFFMLGGGTLLVAERVGGTLRRLIVMPMHKSVILLGKFTGIYISGILQMALMIVAGAVLFKVSWGNDPVALAILVLVYGFTVTSLGILLGAFAKTPSQASSLSTLGVMAMSALGGAWWQIEIVPGWMQQLALAFPTGWAMRGFHDLITRGLSLPAIVPELAALGAFAVVFLAVGVWKFKYE